MNLTLVRAPKVGAFAERWVEAVRTEVTTGRPFSGEGISSGFFQTSSTTTTPIVPIVGSAFPRRRDQKRKCRPVPPMKSVDETCSAVSSTRGLDPLSAGAHRRPGSGRGSEHAGETQDLRRGDPGPAHEDLGDPRRALRQAPGSVHAGDRRGPRALRGARGLCGDPSQAARRLGRHDRPDARARTRPVTRQRTLGHRTWEHAPSPDPDPHLRRLGRRPSRVLGGRSRRPRRRGSLRSVLSEPRRRLRGNEVDRGQGTCQQTWDEPYRNSPSPWTTHGRPRARKCPRVRYRG